MTELEKFIEKIRILKNEAPQTIVILPRYTHSLPIGSYNLQAVLEFIALNLEGKEIKLPKVTCLG